MRGGGRFGHTPRPLGSGESESPLARTPIVAFKIVTLLVFRFNQDTAPGALALHGRDGRGGSEGFDE